jgi:hypothetical protein
VNLNPKLNASGSRFTIDLTQFAPHAHALAEASGETESDGASAPTPPESTPTGSKQADPKQPDSKPSDPKKGGAKSAPTPKKGPAH